MNNPNPPRKCGTKKHDSFYAEGGELEIGGALRIWTWLLGNGMEDNVFLEVPARQVVAIDPVLTVFFKSFMYPTDAKIVIPEELEELYDRLNLAMKSPGVADHVGANYYTAHNFASEVRTLGPSRRIPKKTARYLAEIISIMGPIPMLFTHSKIPVFKDIHQLNEAINIFHEVTNHYLYDTTLFWEPTWMADDWGMYARRDQMPGDDHFMLPILSMIDDIDSGIIEDERIEDFFKSLDYVEQTLGLSWLTKVTYTLPKDDNPLAYDDDIYEIPGLNILDLDAVRELDVIIEDANERT